MFTIMKKIVNVVICHILYRVKYENIELLEKFDQCLICPNHSNIFDPAFIFPKTESLYILAKSELFTNKILAKIFTHYQVFPIRREKSDISGVKHMINLFHKNEKIKLLIFPEGGILKENRRKEIKNGAVHIAGDLNLPIFPVSITENPKLFHKVVVKVNEPFFPPKEVLEKKEKLQEVSEKLLHEIYKNVL